MNLPQHCCLAHTLTASTGKEPAAVSPESITQSVPSSTAVHTCAGAAKQACISYQLPGQQSKHASATSFRHDANKGFVGPHWATRKWQLGCSWQWREQPSGTNP
eukprot:581331-Pelagomonas_calceolata.AAC.5